MTGEELECDLCIAGAGIAGLNALFAASRHLAQRDRIVLLERADGPAGMWNETYDFVRLHQPHPMFTVGNIAWRNQPDRYHLATKAEVLDHLGHCYDLLQRQTGLLARFGHEFLGHEEGQGERAVTVRARRVSDGALLTIRARRLIKAFGSGIQQNPPLTLSSSAVQSVSPDSYDLFGPEGRASTSPIYVIGGGKTGMDTVHTLTRRLPGRRIHFVLGKGTMFVNRDLTVPRGPRRHFAGCTPLDVFRDTAFRFDGHNEVEVMQHFRDHYAVWLNPACERFMFGVLSPRENREIAAGCASLVRDYLEDVVDTLTGPAIELRSGQRMPVEPGALFVNTTGYLKRRERDYEPYLSAGGHVLSITPTSLVHFLTTQAAYFLTHLFMAGTLRGLPLYETDAGALRAADKALFAPTAMAMVMHNTSIIMQHLPRFAIKENGLNPLLMSPRHRRALSIAKLILASKREPRRLTSALDTVQQRLGVRLGPLGTTPRA